MEALETTVHAAVRELEEETGLHHDHLMESLQFVDVLEGARLTPPVPWIAVGYVVRVKQASEASVRNMEPDKHAAVQWFSVQEILDNIENKERIIDPFTQQTFLHALSEGRDEAYRERAKVLYQQTAVKQCQVSVMQ